MVAYQYYLAQSYKKNIATTITKLYTWFVRIYFNKNTGLCLPEESWHTISKTPIFSEFFTVLKF